MIYNRVFPLVEVKHGFLVVRHNRTNFPIIFTDFAQNIRVISLTFPRFIHDNFVKNCPTLKLFIFNV